MMTPFKDNGAVSTEQSYYNTCQATSRNVIERGFGMMKSRFPRLRYLDMYDLDRMTRFIISCCRMHNFCLSEDKLLGLEIDFILEEDDETDVNNIVIYGSSSRDAERKRREIVRQLNA